jgi:hypothetical protein
MAEETKLSIVAQLRAENFTKGVRKMQRQLNQVGRSAQQVGGALTKSITGPVVLAFGAATKVAVDFEKAMAGVAAVSGFAKDDMQALEAEAKKLGATTQLTASQAAGLQTELAKLGFAADEIIQLQGAVASLSIAFGIDLSDAAERTGNILRQFSLDASSAGEVADTLAVAFGSSALDSESLSEALVKVAPTANALGFSLQEVTGVLGELANNGVKGSIAGTAFNKILVELAKRGGDVKKNFRTLLTESKGVSEGFEEFGDRAGKVIPILAESVEEVDKLTGALDDSFGASDKARAILEDTADGALRKLASQAEAAGIALGEVLLPFLNTVVKGVTQLVKRFTDLSLPAKTAITIMATLAAAIGPVIFAIGSLSLAASSLLGVAAALGTTVAGILGPFALLAGAIAAVGMLAFASATAEANRELRKQNDLIRDREKLKKDDLRNNEKNVTELEDIISLVEDGLKNETFGIVSEKALQNLSKEGNQFGLALRNMRNEYRGVEGAGEIILQNFKDQLKVQREKVTAAEKERIEAARIVALDAANTPEAKIKLAKELATAAQGIEEANFVDFKSMADDSEDLVESLLKYELIADRLSKVNLSPVAQDEEQDVEETFEFDGATKFNAFREQSKVAAKDFKEGFLLSIGEVKNGLLDAFAPENLEGTITFLTASFSSIFDAILDGSQSVGEAIKNIFVQLIKGALSTALANAIAAAFSPASPDNIVTGGAAAPAKAAAGTAAIAGLFGAIPAFAEGGAVTSSTLALIGEKPGSRGEAIIPFEKMGDFIGQIMPEGMGGNVVVTGRISGNDIAISNSRGESSRGRRF